MNGETRRSVQLGKRTDTFSDAYPDANAGYTAAAGKLKGLLGDVGDAAKVQRDGLVAERTATGKKRSLRRAILRAVAHFIRVGRVAAREEPGLDNTFRFKPSAGTYLALLTAGRSMAAEAQSHRDLLVKHGLAETVLEEFVQTLDQFDLAITQGNDARTKHIGATADLEALSAKIRETVRVMDGRNRQRFQGDPELLASWIAASTIGRARRGVQTEGPAGEQPAGGDVRPAA